MKECDLQVTLGLNQNKRNKKNPLGRSGSTFRCCDYRACSVRQLQDKLRAHHVRNARGSCKEGSELPQEVINMLNDN